MTGQENGFRHDVRFYGVPAVDGGISARCRPCMWAVSLEGGHTAADFAELERQHCGAPVAAQDDPGGREQLAAIRLILDSFDWESDDAHFALEQVDDVLNGGDR